jgi:2-C-methyl-D-erythritol 2,4-cyclodiphosphate synthase
VRVGFGYDSHRFEEGRKLVLGGVVIPFEKGLKGHSDADVLIHAIIDALLGAAVLGDIGSHFPDTDEKWRGADSTKLLESVVAEVRDSGWRVGNVDATIICERPKLSSHIATIRKRLAGILFPGEEDGVDRISVKGKTNEKMDDVGSGVGIEVHAITLLEKVRN